MKVFVAVGVEVNVFAGVGVKVLVAVDVGVNVFVAVGVEPAEQLGNLNDPTRSRHPAALVVGTYSLTYQNVQSSIGSIFIEV